MKDVKLVRLGKKPARHDDRTLQLAHYLSDPGLTFIPPTKRRWDDSIVDWGMMGNDKIGDCTIAGAAHMIECWTAINGMRRVIPDADVITAYSAITGYDPTTGAHDDGAVLLDVLNHWRSDGIGGDKILGYAQGELGNKQHVEQIVDLFGGCYVGLQLPVTAQNQVGRTWSVTRRTGQGAPGSWGGHCVCVVDYDRSGLTCVTWGALQRMTWGFWNEYCDEYYGVLSSDWAAPGKIAPSGFDLATLQGDLSSL